MGNGIIALSRKIQLSVMVIFLQALSHRPAAPLWVYRQSFHDLGLGILISVEGMAKEDKTQYGKAVFRCRQLGVGPELVGCRPEFGFQLPELFACHGGGAL